MRQNKENELIRRISSDWVALARPDFSTRRKIVRLQTKPVAANVSLSLSTRKPTFDARWERSRHSDELGVYVLHLMEFPMNFKSIFEQSAREVSGEGQPVIVCDSTFMCDQRTDLSASIE